MDELKLVLRTYSETVAPRMRNIRLQLEKLETMEERDEAYTYTRGT